MLLLTVREWLGPGRLMPPLEAQNWPPTENVIAFATKLPLPEAIDRLHRYELGYNEKYRLAVNYNLLSVSVIEDLSPQQMRWVCVTLIEDLDLYAPQR